MSELPKKSDGTWAWLLVMLVFLGGLGSAMLFFMTRYMAARATLGGAVTVTPPPPAYTPPTPAAKRMVVYAPPIITDVNGDAKDDIVSMRWDPEDHLMPLYVVAVDGVTFDPIWTAGPFPGQWGSSRTHLVKSGDKLFLTESTSHLHVIDVRTGGVDHALLLDSTPAGLAGASTGAPRALVRVEGEWDKGLLVDAAGTATRVPFTPGFGTAPTTCASKKPDKNETCESWTGTPPVPKKAGFTLAMMYRRDQVGVAVGTVPQPGPRTVRASYLVGVDTKNKVIWERETALDPDALDDDAHVSVKLLDKLYVLYQLRTGAWKLGALDPATGDVIFVAKVPHPKQGISLTSFEATSDRLYVLMSNHLEVFDASTGSLRATIGL